MTTCMEASVFRWIEAFVDRTWPWFFLVCVGVSIILWAVDRRINRRKAG